MLNRSQLITLFGLNRRNRNPLYRFPKGIRHAIWKTGSDTIKSVSDIDVLLHHIAYGNLVAAKAMLKENPRLVLLAGNTKTRSGLKVLHTTPLECALGAGDPKMAEMIAQYFDANEMTGGAKVREEQFAHYRQHIMDMLNPEKNPPYNFTLLIKTLMAATPEDVAAALNSDMYHESALSKVLTQFRKDFTEAIITRGMHFNYVNLLVAFRVYLIEWRNLALASRGCEDGQCKFDVFWRQVIGYIERGLPAIDRQAFAQGIYHMVKNEEIPSRFFDFRHGVDSFRDEADEVSLRSGLGFELAIHMMGSSTHDGRDGMQATRAGIRYLETYVEKKNTDLLNVCDLDEKKKWDMINQNVSDQKYQFMTDLKSKLSKLSDDELTKIEVEISSAYRGMGKKNYDLFRKAYGETSVGQACMDMMIEIRVERSIMSIRH